MVFTFWEGKCPEYIQLCIDTWHFPFLILNYNTVNLYTELPIDKLKQLTLPQAADCVRAHVLRDNGGYWLDADTIMLSDNLPDCNMLGYPERRDATIGMLKTEAHSDMFEKWSAYQDGVLEHLTDNTKNIWNIMGNAFTDKYVKEHPEIVIGDIRKRWVETYKIGGDKPRMEKYREFYFKWRYHLSDIDPTDMIMLHNSWTPDWYKNLSLEELATDKCTLSNILMEAL